MEAFPREQGIVIDIYQDDWNIDVEGDPERVADNIVEASKAVEKLVKDDLRCELAMAKAALVASTEPLAKEIRGRLGKLKLLVPVNKAAMVARRLGIDHSAGRARGARG